MRRGWLSEVQINLGRLDIDASVLRGQTLRTQEVGRDLVEARLCNSASARRDRVAARRNCRIGLGVLGLGTWC